METEPRKAFKDYFDRAAALRLARQVQNTWPAFPEKRFVREAMHGLEALEFHGRVVRFADALRATLPDSVPEALKILTESLPPAMADCEAITDGWLQWPLGQYIADHGVPFFEESMVAMVELTQRFSSEFAVRPFIEAYPERTLARLVELTAHPNPHVRRWCSEGSRPRLPWGRRLQALAEDPTPLWPILEPLKDDPELYVRRSVANSINDIAKDHPEAVVARCRKWQRGAGPERHRVIQHGLRTLVKAGHPEALAVIGYQTPTAVTAAMNIHPRRVSVGGSVECEAVLENSGCRRERLVIDYAVNFVRQGGKTGRKVFKWKVVELEPEQRLAIRKQHSFRPTTVRALYRGRHEFELQVNGQVLAKDAIELS